MTHSDGRVIRRQKNICGVGVDLVTVKRFSGLDRDRDAAFLERLFQESELKKCFDRACQDQSLAGRFALKEAVIKALPGTPLTVLNLNEIQVATAQDGAPEVVLPGSLDRKYGVHGSIAHESTYAVGFAVARREGQNGSQ